MQRLWAALTVPMSLPVAQAAVSAQTVLVSLQQVRGTFAAMAEDLQAIRALRPQLLTLIDLENDPTIKDMYLTVLSELDKMERLTGSLCDVGHSLLGMHLPDPRPVVVDVSEKPAAGTCTS